MFKKAFILMVCVITVFCLLIPLGGTEEIYLGNSHSEVYLGGSTVTQSDPGCVPDPVLKQPMTEEQLAIQRQMLEEQIKLNQQLEQRKKDQDELVGTAIGLGVTYFLIGI